jgi:mannitol/fructose-specific phosphotransferase system IIA component (Ntr-type)
LTDKATYIQSVYDREGMGLPIWSTSLPSARQERRGQGSRIGFGRSRKGFQYDTVLGGGEARLIFLLAIPNRYSADAYMAVLASLARCWCTKNFGINYTRRNVIRMFWMQFPVASNI